ncbi:hypothetical protein CAPTEDRAFT_198806 [Capitella teleta]|uniref:Uncharacterized protein n=1 Tax=Capitella teleta TaxID=283909 RepID=R7TJI4_CAPTE|nr:hypothetical protein CAPTEDRAFT_198806 [Capitella teleta]|eukprot:ELT93662.1 hypothetical protein CAPTEDRAFT_198806 [Capitella teleta]
MHHEHSQSTPEQDLYMGLVQADEEQESLRAQKDADFIFSAYHPFLQNRIPRSATRCSMESACEFGAWSQCVHVRKQERCKDPKTNHSRHEFSWSRDQKTKPIQFAFKHYTDCKKYIQQYRYDHTYGLCMPPEKTSAEVTVVQGEEGHEDKPPSGHKARSTPTSASQSRGINRHNSDPSLLELAHRYKLAPSVLREAREQSTLKARPDPAQGSGDSEAEPPKVPCPTTNLSCVVPKEATRSVATMLPFAAVTAAPKKGKTSPPSGQSDPKENGQRTNQQVKVPVMVGKAVKHLPANGYAIDSTSRCTAPGFCSDELLTTAVVKCAFI